MVRTQISFDEDLLKRARQMARRKRVSLAELCRRGLQEILSREPDNKPWMAFAGAYEGAPEDSESVDAVVYGREEP